MPRDAIKNTVAPYDMQVYVSYFRDKIFSPIHVQNLYIYPRYMRIWFYTTHITVDTNDYTEYAIQKAEVAVTQLTEIYPAQQQPSLDQSHHQESK